MIKLIQLILLILRIEFNDEGTIKVGQYNHKNPGLDSMHAYQFQKKQ